MKRGLFIIIFLLLIPISFASKYFPSFEDVCGDSKQGPGETCKNCPMDSPCLVDEFCIPGGICIKKPFPPLFLREDPDATIIIPLEVAETLNYLFEQSTDKEFLACLKGKYAKGRYQITSVEIPDIKHQDPVEYFECKRSTVAAIHSRLFGSCSVNEEDIKALEHKKAPLTAIMCGRNKFKFYSKESRPMNVIIRKVENKRANYFWVYFPWVLSGLLTIVLLFINLWKNQLKRSLY